MISRIRLVLHAAALLAGAGLFACGDAGGPGGGDIRTEAELNILQLAPGSPPLFNAVDSFYAVKGDDREARIFFQDEAGGQGEEFLRLRVDAPSLLAGPDGIPFLAGDSVLITVRVVDASLLLFEFEPAGLTFNPLKPAELKIEYGNSGPDFDDDGEVDAEDSEIESQLFIWRQGTLGDPFTRVGTLRFEDSDEAEADILAFSRYALAY